jgi:hypothetical protein
MRLNISRVWQWISEHVIGVRCSVDMIAPYKIDPRNSHIMLYLLEPHLSIVGFDSAKTDMQQVGDLLRCLKTQYKDMNFIVIRGVLAVEKLSDRPELRELIRTEVAKALSIEESNEP